MLGYTPALLITRIITLMVAFTIHEFSHAWVAKLSGDDTAQRAGRLSLNPMVHLDVLGTLMLIVAGFGWAKPVPINPYTLNRKSPYAISMVSAAGPVSNLLLAVLAALPFRLNLVQYTGATSTFFPSLGEFLISFIIINITLFIFNLIPISPLDGEKIIYSFLPPSIAGFMDRIRPYGSLIFLGLIMMGRFGNVDILSALMSPVLRVLFRWMVGA
jgi:Zn-dependent protease